MGRIYDWYKKEKGGADIPAAEDPGVASVTKIFDYYKKYDYKTQVMGASFRKVEQIIDLAGSDLLTISPDLLEKMTTTQGTVTKKLDAAKAKVMDIPKLNLDEKKFRWTHNEDAMAHRQGAVKASASSAADARKLEKWAASLVAKK